MKGKISLLTRKIFASIIAVAMSIPPTAFANTNQPVVYDANSSVMGLAETKDVENPQVANDDETKVVKDLGDYYLEISSKLDPSLTKIDYTIRAKRKEKLDKESQTNLSLTLTKTTASNINNIKLVSASTDTKINNPDFKEELDGLVITSKANNEIIYELSADVNEAKDKRAYELIVGIKEDDKEANIFAYNLEAKTAITLQDNNEVEVINLVSKEEKLTKAKGEYKKEGIFGGIFASRDTITWTDYIVNEKEEVTYDFNLDQNQDITNSQIILDYYEQTENGFEIKKEFSQKIDYSNKVKFEIPAGFVAKITLKTEVDKKNTAIKSYSLNESELKNPIYI